jgi:hypothetical protein
MKRILTFLLAMALFGGGFLSAQIRTIPSITITTATADTSAENSLGAAEVNVQFKFGTVAGSYTGCTVQTKTSYDGGTNYLTLGSAVAITVTSTTLNAWTITSKAGSSETASSTVALGFGQVTKFTFACSGYGTSAPVTVSAIFRNNTRGSLPPTAYPTAGAITVKYGVAHLTLGSAGAYTIADPVSGSDDGCEITVMSDTAYSHTLDNSAGSGFNGAGSSCDVVTFGGEIGDSITLTAYLGKWYVKSSVDVSCG